MQCFNEKNVFQCKSRQQMETFCWLGSLSVLLETVEEGAEVM